MGGDDERAPLGAGSEVVTAQDVWEKLAEIPDPEIPVISLVDLGVVRDVEVEDGRVRVAFTPTFLGCPALETMRRELEAAIAGLERRFEPSPGGLGVTVGWGLPYFRRYVPRLAKEHIPVDLRASKSKRQTTRALLDAIRFPSDPDSLILERNDVAVLLRSDVRDHVAAGARALFDDLRDLFAVTSIRKGFAGGGFGGQQSLPKQMAIAAGVPGADLIPDTAELFLGFTSTQKAGLGTPRIALIATLG